VATDLVAGALGIGPDGATLTWNTVPGLTYRLQYKNDLNEPSWNDVPGDVTATTTVVSMTDAAALTNVARFYRITALP
jgi:hypothetical protein